MTFKELKNKIKEEQKSLAQKIKEQKKTRKDKVFGFVHGLDENRWTYRHKHIAYCQLFNRTPYNMIEISCNDKPSKHVIENYMLSWEGKIDEALRNCA